MMMAVLAALALAGCMSPATDCVSMAARESLDDALARVPAGGVLCLPAGEVAPASAPIAQEVTLRGATDSSGAHATTLTGGAGRCLMAMGVESGEPRYPMIDASAVVVTAGTATVTLEALTIEDCTYGVVARAARTVLQDVRIDSVLVAAFADHGATLEAHGSDLFSGTRRPDGSGPSHGIGVLMGGQTGIVLDDVLADGNGLGFGLRGTPSSLVVMDGELRAFSFALAIDDRSDPMREVMVTGTHVHGLVPIMLVGVPPTTGNVLASGSVTIENAMIEGNGSASFGLQLEDVEHAAIRGTTFIAHDHFALGVFGGSVEVGDGTTFDIPAPTAAFAFPTGIVAAPHPTSGRMASLSLTSVARPIVSSSAAGGVHMIAQSGCTIGASAANVMLMGGDLGVFALGGSLALTGSGFAVTGTRVAAVGAVMNGSATLDGIALTPGADAIGVLAEDTARLMAANVVVTGGRIGIEAEDHSALIVRGGMVVGPTQTGIYVSSDEGATDVSGVTIQAAGTGLVVEGAGARVRIHDAIIMDALGAGAEARRGSVLTVIGTRIQGAHGAALAFTDADGFVAGSMISSTATRADGRADDFRVVSTDGATHSVDLGDDGDGIIMSSDLNFIVVDPGRTCAGRCSVVLSEGAGAQAVVRPNCLTGDAAQSADVHTLVDQDGGAFIVPAPQTWTGQFAGLASGLGLIPGSPATVIAIGAPPVIATATIAIPGL